jgi:organic radical activating enzyme
VADKVKIKELFTSIQGEGPFVGYKQIFIRFCGCNLACNYCDTDFDNKNSIEYTVDELVDIIGKHTDCHSVSLTGGEPLLNTGFLKEFLPECPIPTYLETNATLSGELKEIIDYIDYISADIKLPSVTGGSELWNEHDSFFKAASHKVLFAKIVFDSNITEKEINESCKLGAKYGIELILQPKMNGNNLSLSNEMIEIILDKFLNKYRKVRVIPQTHKFIDVR